MNAVDDTGLVDAETCIKIVFPTERRPELRTFKGWEAKGWIPVVKIAGRLCFYDPAEVTRALKARFGRKALEY
jgi:hypothetical protein